MNCITHLESSFGTYLYYPGIHVYTVSVYLNYWTKKIWETMIYFYMINY